MRFLLGILIACLVAALAIWLAVARDGAAPGSRAASLALAEVDEPEDKGTSPVAGQPAGETAQARPSERLPRAPAPAEPAPRGPSEPPMTRDEPTSTVADLAAPGGAAPPAPSDSDVGNATDDAGDAGSTDVPPSPAALPPPRPPMGSELLNWRMLPEGVSWYRIDAPRARGSAGFGRLEVGAADGTATVAWQLKLQAQPFGASSQSWVATLDGAGSLQSLTYALSVGGVQSTCRVTRRGGFLEGEVTDGDQQVLRSISQAASAGSLPSGMFAVALCIPATGKVEVPIFAEDSDCFETGVASFWKADDSGTAESPPVKKVMREQKAAVVSTAWVSEDGNLQRLDDKQLYVWTRVDYPTEFLGENSQLEGAPVDASAGASVTLELEDLDVATAMSLWLDAERAATWWLGDIEIEPSVGGQYIVADSETGHTQTGIIRELTPDRLRIAWKNDPLHWRACDELEIVASERDQGGSSIQLTFLMSRTARADQVDEACRYWKFYGERLRSAGNSLARKDSR